MVKKIYAIFFLILEAGTLLFFVSHGIFGGLGLILLLLIALNVIKLRSLFTDKEESPGKPAGGAVNATGRPANVDNPLPTVPDIWIPTEIPGTIPGEIPGEKEEFTEEQMEEYRAFAQKIMRENPDITIRQCLYCGGQFPFMLPRCPYCGR